MFIKTRRFDIKASEIPTLIVTRLLLFSNSIFF